MFLVVLVLILNGSEALIGLNEVAVELPLVLRERILIEDPACGLSVEQLHLRHWRSQLLLEGALSIQSIAHHSKCLSILSYWLELLEGLPAVSSALTLP